MSANDLTLIKIVDQAIEQNATVIKLKSDVAELKSDVSVLKSDVAELKSDVAVLKSDVAELKSDVAVLKSDVAELKSDVAVLKQDVVTIKGDIRRLDAKIDRQGAELRELIHRQAIAAENTDRNIMLILDAVIPAQARAEKIDRLGDTVDNHEIRLSVVEGAVKQHLSETHSSRS